MGHKTETHRHRQERGGDQREGDGQIVKGKRGKHMVMEDDLTLGGGHIVQYTDRVSQKYTLETSIILLTNATPINLIKII